MLTILGDSESGHYCDGVSRRTFLKIGGLALGGMSLPGILRAEQAAGIHSSDKAIIMILLPGGPPHLDMFDLKPDAPAEIRGEFKPISTRLPGLQICEHLPRMANWMDRLTLVRSMTHPYPTHCVAYALSGIPQNPLRDPREYWPFYASAMDYLWNRDPSVQQPRGMPRNMCLPWALNSHSTNLSHRGVTAAWLGQQWEPIFGEFDGKASREIGFPSADGAKDPRINNLNTFTFAV